LLRTKRPDLPPQLEAVVWRALRREPAERYQSMAELRNDLLHLDQVKIPEYPTNMGGRSFFAREQLVSAGVVVAALLIIAALGVAAELAHRAQVAP